MCPPARFPVQVPCEAVGAVINRPVDSVAMAACPHAPPFSFWLRQKRMRRARWKRKRRLGALRCSGPPRDGGRRIGASADLGWPSGTLWSSAVPVTAVPWRMVPTSSGWSSHGAAHLSADAPLAVGDGLDQRLEGRTYVSARPISAGFYSISVGADALIGPEWMILLGIAGPPGYGCSLIPMTVHSPASFSSRYQREGMRQLPAVQFPAASYPFWE